MHGARPTGESPLETCRSIDTVNKVSRAITHTKIPQICRAGFSSNYNNMAERKANCDAPLAEPLPRDYVLVHYTVAMEPVSRVQVL